jgi:tRNA (guanine37-N1)-methyltransferase
MRFDIITVFPVIFDSYFRESIIERAQKKELIKIEVHDLRDYTSDKHKTVDDTPYGGGPGMILKIKPIHDCVEFLKSKVKSQKSQPKADPPMAEKSRTILFSAKGKKYTQIDAKRLSKYENLILICGRYEGVDERVAKHIADEEISIGDYVLTGGEIPAMVIVDSITRLIPGVLGNPASLNEESFSQLKTKNQKLRTNLEYPQYTKPETFNKWKVPKVLLSGNHKKIEEWRRQKSKIKIQK